MLARIAVCLHRKASRYGKLEPPRAKAYYTRCLSLPISPQITDDDVHYVVSALEELVRS
jgi:dTDP-4-amino-4,6-dideoxygalactose transaminase